MSYFKIIGFALISLFACMLLKRIKEEYAVFISIFSGISLTLTALSVTEPLLRYINSLCTFGGSSENVTLMVKSACIAVITGIASDLCRDCGEGSLGMRLEMCGKALIISLALPLVKNVFDACLTLL